MVITSINNGKIKELVKLKDKKYRNIYNLFFVEGIDFINEAYKNKKLKELYIICGYDNPFPDIPCTYISYDLMKKISDMESISPYYGICYKLSNNDFGNKIIVLDDINDPGNLGTIIRSAVAFNFDTVVIGSNSVDLYNSKVIRSTKGMLFNINIITVNLEEFFNKVDGYMIYGTDVLNGIDIRNENIPDKVILVIGNEGHGISDNIKKYCHKFIYIDMNKNCESLNAGVSASILMYEVNKNEICSNR